MPENVPHNDLEDVPHNDSDIKGRISRTIRRYVEKRLELFMMIVTEQLAFILAELLQRLIGILILAGGGLFAWFALSYYLSNLVDSIALGFLLSSLPLIVGGLLFMKLKPAFITRFLQAGMLRDILKYMDSVNRKKAQFNRKDQKHDPEA